MFSVESLSLINIGEYAKFYLAKWTPRINSYMEMMNSCSTVIPFKYLVFNLELSRVLDTIVLI
jgi:hypothetical protein